MHIEELIPGVNLESYTVEFKGLIDEGSAEDGKSRKERSWLRTLAAFANTEGGVLYVGVDDRTHGVLALSHSDADHVQLMVQRLLSERTEPVIHPRIEPIPVPAKDGTRYVLAIHVEKSKHPPVTLKEGGSPAIYIRRAGQNSPASGEEIRFLVLNSDQIPYDSFFTDEEYDPARFRRLCEFYEKEHPGEELSARELVSMGFLSPEGRLSRGALLFQDGDKDPRTLLVCTHYPGFDKGSDLFLATRARKGCLLDVIETALSFVRERSVSGFRKTEDGQVDAFSYPPMAVREAVVNAVCHRNYYLQGRQVEVNIYRDRLEIVSPGSLPNSLGVHGERNLSSIPPNRRNEVVASVLSALRLMERRGSGFQRIEASYRGVDPAHLPFADSDDSSFILTLPDLQYGPGLLGDQENPSVTAIPVPPGSRSLPILSFCFLKERNAPEIAAHVGLAPSSYFRSKILGTLVEKGYLLARKGERGETLYRANPAKVTLE